MAQRMWSQEILSHIPERDRQTLIDNLISSLTTQDEASLNFVASLVVNAADAGSRERLVAFLDKAIRASEATCAVSASLKFPELGRELLSSTASAIRIAKSVKGGLVDESVIHAYLSFAQSVAPRLPLQDAHFHIFQSCLALLVQDNAKTSKLCRDVLFALLSAQNESIQKSVVLPQLTDIWATVQCLTLSKQSKWQMLLGYSLWLRLIISLRAEDYAHLITRDYWNLILDGLRHGDLEQRKICLGVLKLTISAHPTALQQADPREYERYCTVFETIVLGRYINQVQECQADLDFLARQSSIDPRWLFALLSAALDTSMQDSNRKFIGTWVMQTPFEPTRHFVLFFRDAFLPWAIQGHLFVSGLRRGDTAMRCLHGDRLSGLIQDLSKNGKVQQEISTIVVDTILQRRSSLFPYAIVYLLDGIKTILTDDQKEKLSTLFALPEVARDFVSINTRNTTNSKKPRHAISRTEELELKVVEKYNAFDASKDDVLDLWADLDQLDYPKRLLMIIPEKLFHPDVVTRAVKDAQLAKELVRCLEALQKVTLTKAYLFSPLTLAIRTAVMQVPAAFEVLELEDYIVGAAKNPPSPTIDLLLEEATVNLTPNSYEHYFGPRLTHGIAAFIDLVSRLGQKANLVEAVLQRILQRWKSQKNPPATVTVWKNALQLQTLLLCLEQYTPASERETTDVLEDLFYILAIEPLPQYRFLMEWMVVRLVTRFELKDTILHRLRTKDHHSNPKHLASLMKTGVTLACSKESDEDFALQLATTFVPLAASSKIVIRHEAQWQVPLLMDHAKAAKWTRLEGSPAFAAIDEYIRFLERFSDPPRDRIVSRFNADNDHNLTNLFDGLWLELDAAETPLTTHGDLAVFHNDEAANNLRRPCMPLGNAVERVGRKEVSEVSSGKVIVGPRSSDEVSALQTKGTAYLARTLSDPSLLDARPHELIVVASLVENPYNLGGLSRVSEIFGASALCLQNQNVVSNKDFTSVSVSSHLHFPIIQLSASGLPEFLAERKAEAFTVVGIEQTDRSLLLGSEQAKLPKKVVLVVGSEKEGIPAVVLTACDLLVEIPQQGITRSLNVQTAVSIVLYEHARQHGKG